MTNGQRNIARRCREQAATGRRLLALGVTLLIVQAVASCVLALAVSIGA